MKFSFIIYISIFILINSNYFHSQLIISLLLKNQNIINVKSSINSILNQNVDHSLFKIVLIVSQKNKRQYFSKEFISFIEENGIQLKVIKNRYIFFKID